MHVRKIESVFFFVLAPVVTMKPYHTVDPKSVMEIVFIFVLFGHVIVGNIVHNIRILLL